MNCVETKCDNSKVVQVGDKVFFRFVIVTLRGELTCKGSVGSQITSSEAQALVQMPT